jgi:hypothetical protein
MSIFNSAFLHFIISIGIMGCGVSSKLNAVKTIPYPSSSGVEYAQHQFYVMGDDATVLLVLDHHLNTIDSLPIVAYPVHRIPKDKKPDIEALALTTNQQLWMIGSGATPQRNNYWIADLANKKISQHSFEKLYAAIKEKAISALNIEGATFMSESLLLANRGHHGFPFNHFVKIDTASIQHQKIPSFQIIPIQLPSAITHFSGISGLCYSPTDDVLFATASTEETNNSLDDGAIGKSYIWIFENFSHFINTNSILPTHCIDLETVDNRFKAHKIESICLEKKTANNYHFLLAADNDNGQSTLFKLALKKD